MLFDSRDGNYHGTLPNGDEIVVDGDVFAEAQQQARKDGGDLATIESAHEWEELASAQDPIDTSIRIVKK